MFGALSNINKGRVKLTQFVNGMAQKHWLQINSFLKQESLLLDPQPQQSAGPPRS